jgi:hypothetical protein
MQQKLKNYKMKKIFLVLIFVSLISTACNNSAKTTNTNTTTSNTTPAPTSSQTNTAPTTATTATSPATTTNATSAEKVEFISKYTTSLPEPSIMDISVPYHPVMLGFVDEEKATALVLRGKFFALVNMNTGEILKQKELDFGTKPDGDSNFSIYSFAKINLLNDKFAVPVDSFVEETGEYDIKYHIFDYDFNLIEISHFSYTGIFDENSNLYIHFNPQTEKNGIYKVDQENNITPIYPLQDETAWIDFNYHNKKLFATISASNTSEERIAVVMDSDGNNVKEMIKSEIKRIDAPYVRGNYALWTDEQVKGNFENCGLATGELLLFNIEKNEFETLKTQYTNETNVAVLSQDGKYVVTSLMGEWYSAGELPDGTNIINVYNAETKELVKTFNPEKQVRDLIVSNNRVYVQVDNDFYVYEI